MTDREQTPSGGQASENLQAPENLGALYSSANFHEVTYRNSSASFSASRIDARARFRYQVLREGREPAPVAQEQTSASSVSWLSSDASPDVNPGASPEASSGIPDDPAASPSLSHRLFASPSSLPLREQPVSPAVPTLPAEVEPSAPPFAADLSMRPRPQWLEPSQQDSGEGAAAGNETLQRTKERVASRWFGLKGLFARSAPPAEAPGEPSRERRVPVVAVFSFAGGVGKTSLIATLARALASHGEQVLLVDTAPFGLLPFYFGARDLKSGVVRTFAPPNNSVDAPVSVMTLDAGPPRGEDAAADPLVETLLLHGQRSQRILVDVKTASKGVMRRLLALAPTVLAPLLPEMNSVVSVNAIESVFAGAEGAAGQIKPFYLLNQFDPSLPLHVDVREVLQEQLGDRLLPFAVRQSSAVSEALAEAMTVIDYAPNASVAEDYLRVADWLRSVSATAADHRGMRWSER